MSWEHVVRHVPLPAVVALAAAVGAWRSWRLLRYGYDPRLVKLAWFFALFAASLVAMTIWTGQLALSASDAVDAAASGAVGPLGERHQEIAAGESANAFLLAHHALMLASLGVAVKAFSHRRAPSAAIAGAAVGFALFAGLIPVFLAAEAALTLYLAVQAVLNHMERRTPGALQVAAGFSLFFFGQLTYFVFHSPGSVRTPLGDVLALVGIVLLVQLLPRPSA